MKRFELDALTRENIFEVERTPLDIDAKMQHNLPPELTQGESYDECDYLSLTRELLSIKTENAEYIKLQAEDYSSDHHSQTIQNTLIEGHFYSCYPNKSK